MDITTRSVLLALVVLLSACGEFIVDDKDFSDNRRSVDIDSDNAESLLWTAYMAGVETFRQSDLAYGLVPQVLGAQSDTLPCVGGGELVFSFSKGPGERLVAGDTFDLQYSNCIKANGDVANGRVSGRYTEVEGYNYTVEPTLDVDQCIARVREEDAPSATIITGEADQVLFRLRGNLISIIYRDLIDSSNQVDVKTETVNLGETAVVLNRSQTVPSSSRAEDGAHVYLLKNNEPEDIDCDEARIKGVLDVTNLIVNGDEVSSQMNAAMDFDFWHRNAANEDYIFESDDVAISLIKNNYTESVSLLELEWQAEIDAENSNSYSLEVQSELLGDAVDGIAEIASPLALRGDLDAPLPDSGQLRVLGEGLEITTFNVDDSTFLRFSVAPEGDVSGDQRADAAPLFSTSWVDFLARNFLRPELVVTTQ
jgi:hypothetical protein